LRTFRGGSWGEVEGAVLAVVVAVLDAAAGEGVVEAEAGAVDRLLDEAEATTGEEVVWGGVFIPGGVEVEEGGELKGGFW
jgi:hypothetical protein